MVYDPYVRLGVRMTASELKNAHETAKLYNVDTSKFVRMLLRKAKKDADEGKALTIPVDGDR